MEQKPEQKQRNSNEIFESNFEEMEIMKGTTTGTSSRTWTGFAKFYNHFTDQHSADDARMLVKGLHV
jgi:hypothetical protein